MVVDEEGGTHGAEPGTAVRSKVWEERQKARQLPHEGFRGNQRKEHGTFFGRERGPGRWGRGGGGACKGVEIRVKRQARASKRSPNREGRGAEGEERKGESREP
jgi:hypothetical protein